MFSAQKQFCKQEKHEKCERNLLRKQHKQMVKMEGRYTDYVGELIIDTRLSRHPSLIANNRTAY